MMVRCRLTLAVAGDTLDDANFEQHTADSMALRLFVELEWMTETMAKVAAGEFRSADSQMTFWDAVLENRVIDGINAAREKFTR